MRNDPCRFIDLKTWSSAHRAVWEVMESLGGGTMLRNTCHSGQSLRIHVLAVCSCVQMNCGLSASCSCCHATPSMSDCHVNTVIDCTPQ